MLPISVVQNPCFPWASSYGRVINRINRPAMCCPLILFFSPLGAATICALMRVGARVWSSNIIYYCQFNNCRLEHPIHTHTNTTSQRGKPLKPYGLLSLLFFLLPPTPPFFSSNISSPPFYSSEEQILPPARQSIAAMRFSCSSSPLRCAAPSSDLKNTHKNTRVRKTTT